MSSETESGCLGELWGYFIALGQLLQVITLILQDKKYGHRQSNKAPALFKIHKLTEPIHILSFRGVGAFWI